MTTDTLTAKDMRELGAQTKVIKEALSDFQWHKVQDLEALSGSRRVAARCFDLKERGYVILSQKDKGRGWSYRMIGPGQGTLL